MADEGIPGATPMKGKFRTRNFKEKKQRGEKIAMLTAYDANMARLLDRAGVDAILVGDSVGMVVLGFETTVPVTLDAMIHHTAAVSRGTERALIVADMPFLTYETTTADAVRNAGRLMQEGGAEAVKVEGGSAILDAVKRLVDVGIPVMGHLGLLPQSVHRVGGFLRQATTPRDADILLADALALEEAGAFAIVLEAIPADVARTVTEALAIPVRRARAVLRQAVRARGRDRDGVGPGVRRGRQVRTLRASSRRENRDTNHVR